MAIDRLATADRLARYSAPRWIAGGGANDGYLGRVTRDHHDVDIAVLRRDQARLFAFLARWDVVWLSPGRNQPPIRWAPGTWLAPPVHQVRAVAPAGFLLELLLNDAHGVAWVYRRDPRGRRSLPRATVTSPAGLPLLTPEIVLLDKSKAPRPIDEAEFRLTLPRLAPERRRWLHAALLQGGNDHSWLALLDAAAAAAPGRE